MYAGRGMIIVVSATLIALGCSEERDVAVSEEICVATGPSEIVAQMSRMTNEIFEVKKLKGFLDERRVAASLAAVTNDDVRLELVEKLADCVLSLDLSRLSYRDQHNAMISIKDIMSKVVVGNFPARNIIGLDAFYELKFGYKLRLMEWWREQIKRTTPKHRIEKPYVVLDEAEEDERDWWRLIHFHGMVCYEMSLAGLEQEFLCLSPRLSPEAAERIKVEIENFLGRPIRTKQQLKDDFKAKRHVEFTEKEDPHAAP